MARVRHIAARNRDAVMPRRSRIIIIARTGACAPYSLIDDGPPRSSERRPIDRSTDAPGFLRTPWKPERVGG